MISIRSILPVVAYGALMLGVAPMPSLGYDYQPLDIGSQWTYDNPSGGLHIMTITGERVVLGTTTRIRHQEEESQIYENYWTSDNAGNLFLHGAYNYDGFEIAYLPPIEMVAAPLFVGKTWVTEDIHLYDLDGTPWDDDPFDYPLRVYSEGEVQVPAGDFYAYGVGYDIGPAVIISRGGRSYNILGRAGDAPAYRPEDNTTDWFTDGIGEPKFGYIQNEPYVLLSYDLPVPVASATWGRIRNLYRRGR